MQTNRKSLQAIALVWVFFIVRGLHSIMILPLWGGFDEWLHYSYVAYLSETGKLPVQNVPSVPQEVYESIQLTPADSYTWGQPSFAQFWTLTKEERATRILKLEKILCQPETQYKISSWQAQHPPLFYGILVPIYKILHGTSLVGCVRILRIVSILIASLALWPAYRLMRLFLDSQESLFGLLLIAAYPATFILLGHLTNDCLAFPIVTALIFLTLHQWQKGITLKTSVLSGLLLGLGLMTKLYCLTLLPLLMADYLYWFLRLKEGKAALLKYVFFFGLTALLVSGWWFRHNLLSYGTWNPTVHTVETNRLSLAEKFKAIPRVDWKSFIISNVIGILWAGNWSFVPFPSAVYKIFSFALLTLGLVLLIHLWRSRQDKELWSMEILILGSSISFLLGMIQHQIHIRLPGNMDSMGGWYWTVLLPTHILLSFSAVRSLVPGFKLKIFKTTLLIFYALTLWAYDGILLPYYTGLLTKFQITQGFFHSFSWRESLQRIASLNSLSPSALPFLAVTEIVLFCVALRHCVQGDL